MKNIMNSSDENKTKQNSKVMLWDTSRKLPERCCKLFLDDLLGTVF